MQKQHCTNIARSLYPTLLLLLLAVTAHAQTFYFGSDLSYVNEMEDCGVVYKEDGTPKDPYEIFASHNTNLVRLRLWHTPSWYDGLNSGHRYSDFADVRHSILRAKAAGMAVLLDFHLSDNWADPSNQVVPKAWEPVVNNLPVLKDSLYNYIYNTLTALHADGLLPELVQIGNETNRGILLSPTVNAAGWSLDWARNAALFKIAIKAVRDVETATNKDIKVALHVAGPSDAGWLMQGFWSNGVQDFDIIGLSYYWAWHQPTTIANAGNIISQLKTTYPGKQVMIFETGYIWTFQSNDNANNIINQTHPNYAPPSAAAQKNWLTDLTQEVINKGGSGVLYWEPAWVSSTCSTQWGQGSHQEHAAFFNFSNNVLPGGGMFWPEFQYQNLSSTDEPAAPKATLKVTQSDSAFWLELAHFQPNTNVQARLFGSNGQLTAAQVFNLDNSGSGRFQWTTQSLKPGLYFVHVADAAGHWGARKVVVD